MSGGITDPPKEEPERLARLEFLVWGALEPELETNIKLDLNDLAQATEFREMVRRVTKSIITDLTS